MVNFKKIRLESGLTQAQVSIKLNVAKNTISQWEIGKREPSIENLAKLSKIYKTSVDNLIGIEKIENNQLEVKQDNLTEEQKKLIEKIKTMNDKHCIRLSSYADCLIDEITEQEKAKDKTIR